MSTAPSDSVNATFAYRAQSADGLVINGTIEADDGQQAKSKLQALGLRIVEMADARPVSPRRPISGSDFLAFNQQLAQMTASGLPIEHGLRLIAQDLQSGRLSRTVAAVVSEMEQGRPLGEAFEAHRQHFPPFYGKLIEAGVKSNNLPGMLMNIGRYTEQVRRFQMNLMQTLMYPAIMLGTLMMTIVFLGIVVIPQFKNIFDDFGTQLPLLTQIVMNTSAKMPLICIALASSICVIMVGLWLLRVTRKDRAFFEALLLPLPIVGALLQRLLLSRWCDALRLAIEAGLSLPVAISLAADAVSWPGLSKDSDDLIKQLQAGQPLESNPRQNYITPSICAVLNLASQKNQLGQALDGLTQMYQQQAQIRIEGFYAFLTPFFIFTFGGIVGLIVFSLFMPLIKLIQTVS